MIATKKFRFRTKTKKIAFLFSAKINRAVNKSARLLLKMSDSEELDPLSLCRPEMASSADDEAADSFHPPNSSIIREVKKKLPPSLTITSISKSLSPPTTSVVSSALYKSSLTLEKIPEETWKHPLELKKLILGELSGELTIRAKRSSKSPYVMLTRKSFNDRTKHSFISHYGRTQKPKWQHGDDPPAGLKS